MNSQLSRSESLLLHGEAGGIPEARWHALWTRSHCEQKVYDQVAARGFRVFLPMLEAWSRRRGYRQRSRGPMFPGYLFIHHAMDKTSYLALYETRGLIRLLGDGWERVAVVPDREIQAIQRLEASRVPAVPYPYLREGQRIRITHGLLAGVEGLYVRSKPSKGLVVISIDLLRRSVAVEVDSTVVEPA